MRTKAYLLFAEEQMPPRRVVINLTVGDKLRYISSIRLWTMN
jgi:hypothetical protein